MPSQNAAEYLEGGYSKPVLMASRRRAPGITRDDLLQEAALRLLEVPGRFDTGRLEERAVSVMRNMARRAFRVASVEVFLESGGVQKTPSPETVAGAVQQAYSSALRLAMRGLSDRQAKVIRLLYEKDLPTWAVAEKLGLAPPQVTKAHQSALAFMARRLKEANIRRTKDVEEKAC